MFDIGFTELLMLAIIGMVVIGPERLPTAARSIGRTLGQLRRYMTNLQNQIEQEVKLDELNKKIMAEHRDPPTAADREVPPNHRTEDAEVPATPPQPETAAADEASTASDQGASEPPPVDDHESRKP
ncbi:MAG: Sec-independent protein translocase protein TatB [Saccharospirillum sp.]